MRVDSRVAHYPPLVTIQAADEPAEVERVVVEQLRQGDRKAFDVVYDAYRTQLHGYFLRVVRHEPTALELSQETWLRLATHAPSLAADTNLRAWLFTVARNVFISYRRWALLDRDRLAEFGLCAPRRAVPTPLDVACRSDLERRVEIAIGELPAKYREVIVLVAIEGFELEKAAQITKLSPAALRKRLSRARALLDSALSDASETTTCVNDPRPVPSRPNTKDDHVAR